MYRLLVWEINVGHSFVCWSSLSLETSPFPHLSSGTCQTGKRYVINRFNFVSFCKTQNWYKWSMCFNFLLLFSRKMAIFVPKAVHMISLLLALWILIGPLLPTGFKIFISFIKPVSFLKKNRHGSFLFFFPSLTAQWLNHSYCVSWRWII